MLNNSGSNSDAPPALVSLSKGWIQITSGQDEVPRSQLVIVQLLGSPALSPDCFQRKLVEV